MAVTPKLNCTVQITAKDINGNNLAKTYNFVNSITMDFVKGMINIVDDVQGSVYHPLIPISSFTDTIVAGQNGQHQIVTS